MLGLHRDERGQSLVIVLSLITIMFLLGSSLAVHGSVALRSTRASEGQGDEFYAADAATELGIWWQRNGKAGNPPAQTINGVTTSTTITTAGGGAGCPSAPTPFWLTGLEHGVAAAGIFSSVFTIGGTYVTAPAAAARSGGYGLMITTANASNYGFATKWLPAVNGAPLIARFALRFPSLPSAAGGNSANLVHFEPSGGNPLYLMYRPDTGRLAMRWGSGTPVESTTTISAGTWYTLDVRATIGDPRTAEWRVDGAVQGDVTSAEPSATWWDSFHLGAVYSGIIISATHYDDVMLSSTSADYPIGDVNVSALLPNGMGTSVNPPSFQHNDNTAIDATSYTRLDETPMTSLTDYIKQVISNTGRYIEMTFADTTQGCIRGVSAVLAYHGAGTATNNGQTNVFAGWQTYLQSGAMNTTTLKYASSIVSTGGAAWSEALLNGVLVRIGYSSDINPLPFWDAILLEYGWRTSAPATITIVGTGGGSTVTTDYTDVGAGIPTLDTWTTTK